MSADWFHELVKKLHILKYNYMAYIETITRQKRKVLKPSVALHGKKA